MEPAQRDPRIDVVLNGRYRITELLGEGGMGLVYRGERLQLGRPVAIKFLHGPYAKSPKYMARFEREARAMSKLSHPYCVSVIDFGVHDEPYIVMDFVTGETLRDLMDKQRVAPARAVHITRQILAGLAHAHGQGVIHRDIKPGNIMVGEATGVGDHVRIFDFGLAKLHDPAVAGEQSTAATVIGTPAYMAPEQTRAEAIDARADLYAVGVLLFELLTGQKPFVGEDAYAVIRMQREVLPVKVRSLAPAISEELEQVVWKALEKDRDKRFQSSAEFVAALDAVPESFQRVTAAPGDSGPPRTPRPKRDATSTHSLANDRSRSTRLSLLGLVLVGAVGTFVYFSARDDGAATEEAVTSAPIDAPAAPLSADSKPAAVAPVEPEATPGAVAAVPAVSPEPVLDASVQAAPVEGEASASDRTALDHDAALALLAPGEGEVVAEQLTVADQALDDTAESEAKPLAVHMPEPRSISDVHTLIEKGKSDAAIESLKQLRKNSPQNPYLPYLLGDLYFSRGWWSDGLSKYREAIKLSDGAYARRATIQKNAIEALGGDRTYAKARVLLVRDIGRSALPLLRRAATKNASPVVQKRARLLVSQIAR
ncbi:MAG: sps1B [Myxococcaceae bacterium]|nr:sps1B [Myxococcaceae bacterium]